MRRLASDRFAQRYRKEGKAAFTIEAEQRELAALRRKHIDINAHDIRAKAQS